MLVILDRLEGALDILDTRSKLRADGLLGMTGERGPEEMFMLEQVTGTLQKNS